jgi:hypothetical protein
MQQSRRNEDNSTDMAPYKVYTESSMAWRTSGGCIAGGIPYYKQDCIDVRLNSQGHMGDGSTTAVHMGA